MGEAALGTCSFCDEGICEHHELIARAMGFKGVAICFACLGEKLEIPDDELVDATLGYVVHKDCYTEEWRAILPCAQDGRGITLPCIPAPVGERYATLAEPPQEGAGAPTAEPEDAREAVPADWEYTDLFDGGETACGDLLFDLRIHFKGLAGGTRVLIRSVDAGSPVDLPAWCRVTGHRLCAQTHPFYLVKKKEE